MSHTEILQELISVQRQLEDAQRANQQAVEQLEETNEEISHTRTTLRKWQCISDILDSTFLLSMRWQSSN